MSDGELAVLFVAVFFVFAGISLIALTRPALFLRTFPNPFMPDTPINRVQLRGLGLVFCLMLLMMLSGTLSGAFSSPVVEAFADNMLLALWIRFLASLYSCGFSGESLFALSCAAATSTGRLKTRHGSAA